jgi:hypothetical protein
MFAECNKRTLGKEKGEEYLKIKNICLLSPKKRTWEIFLCLVQRKKEPGKVFFAQ